MTADRVTEKLLSDGRAGGVHSVGALNENRLMAQEGQSRTLLRMACNLKCIVCFCNFPFNVLELKLTISN